MILVKAKAMAIKTFIVQASLTIITNTRQNIFKVQATDLLCHRKCFNNTVTRSQALDQAFSSGSELALSGKWLPLVLPFCQHMEKRYKVQTGRQRDGYTYMHTYIHT